MIVGSSPERLDSSPPQNPTKVVYWLYWLFGDPGFSLLKTGEGHVPLLPTPFAVLVHTLLLWVTDNMVIPLRGYVPLLVPANGCLSNMVACIFWLPEKVHCLLRKNIPYLKGVLGRSNPQTTEWVHSTGRSNHKASKLHGCIAYIYIYIHTHTSLLLKAMSHVHHNVDLIWNHNNMLLLLLIPWNPYSESAGDLENSFKSSSPGHWATLPGGEIQRPHHRQHQAPRQLRPQPRAQGGPHRGRLGLGSGSNALELSRRNQSAIKVRFKNDSFHNSFHPFLV